MSAAEEPTGSTSTAPPNGPNRRWKLVRAAMLIIQVMAWLATIAGFLIVANSRLT